MGKSLYLTNKELKELTGYVIASKQIKWLENNDIKHYVNGAKKPVVLRATLINTQQYVNNQIINNQQPNFEAL